MNADYTRSAISSFSSCRPLACFSAAHSRGESEANAKQRLIKSTIGMYGRRKIVEGERENFRRRYTFAVEECLARWRAIGASFWTFLRAYSLAFLSYNNHPPADFSSC